MRTGNFTSSEIVALMKNGKKAGELGAPAIEYVNECNMERRLGRPLEGESNARATSWGTVGEKYVFSLLGLEYSAVSKDSILHPEFDFWAGTPDSVCYEEATRTVGDIKCPFTLKSFCQLVDAWERGGIAGIRDYHKDGEKFYWQLVSNAILTGCDHGELIVFAPYKHELDAIREIARHDDTGWIFYADNEELPWLHEGAHYKNLNKFRFPIPEADKQALRKRVEECSKYLVQPFLIPQTL